MFGVILMTHLMILMTLVVVLIWLLMAELKNFLQISHVEFL